MDHLGPGRAAGEVAAGRNLDAAADLVLVRRFIIHEASLVFHLVADILNPRKELL